MSTDPVAEELAGRLLARFASLPEARAVGGDVVAARLSCEQAYRELTRWLGPGSARSLLARGLATARVDHPAVAQFRLGENGERVFDDVPAIVEAHGSATVAAGLRAVLVAMLTLLGRLVGTDLAARLLDDGVNRVGVQDERST